MSNQARLKLRTGEVITLDSAGWHADNLSIESTFNIIFTADNVLDPLRYYPNPLRVIAEQAAKEFRAEVLELPVTENTDPDLVY